ncbi:MAG TPA: sensor histidine kinase [Longimicrobiales bacterium]
MRRIGWIHVPGSYIAGFALATAVGLLRTGYVYLEHVTVGRTTSPLAPLIEELGAAWAAAAFFPVIIVLARRFPLDRRGWARNVPAQVGGALAFAIYHTTTMWATRAALFPLAGLGAYDYGRMPIRYAMEFPQQLITFSLVVALTHLYDRQRAAQERDLRISRLETQLVRARLDALRMQLNPHFLFNTLNTVSSVMYEDLAAADDVLARLGELLRRTMRGAEGQEVPLREELETLDLYVGIMRARFRDRLDVRIDADPAALRSLVPSMLLQPLVENAIEHGGRSDVDNRLAVAVSARAVGPVLRIEVRDTGPGAGDAEPRHGIGLGNTAERLAKLYGTEHRIATETMAGGGFRVTIEIPLREAPAGDTSQAPDAVVGAT